MSELLDAALSYAAQGWHVFPLHTPHDGKCSCRKAECEDQGKHPRTTHGHNDATTDEPTIREWWSRWPEANIGIATGARSGVAVLDIDPAHGGADSLRALLAHTGDTLPETLTCETGGGGTHYWFAPTGPVQTSAGKLGDGIDVRGDGGYVVAAPSLHASGDYYRWAEGRSPDKAGLTAWPSWLTSVTPEREKRDPVDGAIPAGKRNQTLASLAGSMQRKQFSFEAICAALHAENTARCSPPLDPAEVDSIAESIARYASSIDLSSVMGDSSTNESLAFISAFDFCTSVSGEVPWLVTPWVAKGAITELAGKVKASGKTTLLLAMCRAVVDGSEFLGEATKKCPVVYLTEQAGTSFRQALLRAELDSRDDFFLLPWSECKGRAWPDVVRQATAYAHEQGAGLIVVDTLPQFAGFEGDGENSSGAALVAMRPLQQAAAEGLAVVVVRHERKSGGEPGDSGRGSTAFAGAVDIVVTLRRTEGSGENIRVLRALSRFDETPPEFSIELRDGMYYPLGATAAPHAAKAREALLSMLPLQPPGLTVDEVARTAGVSRSTLYDAINELESEGLVRLTGSGKKGDPKRWHRVIDSSAPPLLDQTNQSAGSEPTASDARATTTSRSEPQPPSRRHAEPSSHQPPHRRHSGTDA